jgi:hypothetical protein
MDTFSGRKELGLTKELRKAVAEKAIAAFRFGDFTFV